MFSLTVSLGSGQDDAEDPVAGLEKNIPGTPGEDYPIFAFPPDTSFVCDGKIEGYYADPEADCQSFNMCVNFGEGDLTKYSLLCPNGEESHSWRVLPVKLIFCRNSVQPAVFHL